jgi:hypothetical protein
MDARGYEWIVVDGLLAAEMGNLLDFLIAHEYHHQCRDAVLCYDKNDVDEQDTDVMWVLNQIHAEGIADHIDKPHWFYDENPVPAYSDFVEQYRSEVKDAEGTLNLIDEAIETGCVSGKSHKESGKSHKEIGRRVREILPLSGHPIGYFMSNIISEASFTAEMIESVGNPFEFIRLYDRARETREKSVLSEATTDLLGELEDRYCKYR